MKRRMMELRERPVITLRIDRIRAARTNFFHIIGPIYGIKKGR
ncbi:hypothetical protein AAAV70_30030 [Hungatella hathewayi]